MINSHTYDVIIIGAGIGGLVCGCYLAKAGMKVVLIEANSSVGGYCNSFEIKGYKFDSFVHTLGNISEGSDLFNIFKDLQVLDNLELIVHDPSDIIHTPDLKVAFWHNVDKTIEELSELFPSEIKGINEFFEDILSKKNFDSVQKFRNKTFKKLLREYMDDEKLISILSFMIYCDQGVPPSHISAFSAIKHYANFILNGGYYPKNGIQTLPNILAMKFRESGGELLLSRRAKKISVRDNTAYSVSDHWGSEYVAKYIVSGSDAHTTFLKLVGKEYLSKDVAQMFAEMMPSLTYFAMYIGLNDSVKEFLVDKVNHWFICDYNYDKDHEHEIKYDFELGAPKGFLVCPNFEERRLLILVHAPYKSIDFWKEARNNYMEIILEKIVALIPEIKNAIVFKTAVTPVGLNKWTSNYSGAAYGWAAIPGQIALPEFSRDGIINNLFLCGHWSTIAAGIPGVSFVGKRIAELIINRLN